MHLFLRTSYNLYIQERSGGGRKKAFSVVKDISASASSYVTGPLECNSFYVVYLSVSNAAGESKNASRSFNTTCSTDSGEEDAVPYIFYRTGGEILRKDIRTSGGHFWSPPIRVLQLSEDIVNFCVHQQRGLIFAATRGGSLYRGQLGSTSLLIEGDPLLMAGLPPVAAVSADWLNDRVYILTSSDEGLPGSRQVWSILNCNLAGSDCQRFEGAVRGRSFQVMFKKFAI